MNTTIVKSKNRYDLMIRGKLISTANYYIYDDIKNFDWINIADVETDSKYRRKGYGMALMTKMLEDLDNNYPHMGQYLFVKSNNIAAIRLYQQLGFRDLLLKNSDSGVPYILMIRGNADQKQFSNFNFNFS